MKNPRIDESRPFVAARIGVLVVSDTRDEESDKSGALLAERIESAGHVVARRAIEPDARARVAATLRAWADADDVDAIIATGGTGLTGRDLTPEALRDVMDKEIPGFAMAFHAVSMEIIGVSAIQSRAMAAVVGGTYVFALPGSPSACRDAWDNILATMFDNRARPCNLIEIMPRLNES